MSIRTCGRLWTLAIVAATLTVSLAASIGRTHAQDASPGLAEEKLVRMLELKVKPEVIVSVIRKQGLGFTVDDSVIQRLRKANAPELVVEAVRKAGEPKPLAEKGQPVTYRDVVDLLELGVPEAEVLEKLRQSPTTFTLGQDQTEKLRKLGATETLLEAMGSVRLTVGTASELNNLAIVLDCSGSMSEMTALGRTKMQAAREAAIALVRDTPDGVRLAFVIYGQSRAQECNATQVIRKLEPLDEEGRASLIATIGRLQPVGSTPIARALQVAGQELARASAPCGLVLISDGKEMCGGNPTAEALALSRRLKLDFGVQVVGFGVKPDEQQALTEIAQAGKGKYHDAPTPEALHDVVTVLGRQIEEAKPVTLVKAARALKASTDVTRPTPLELGTMARARIDSNSRTNKLHYWIVDLDKGDYKVVVDKTRSDGRSSNVQGEVNWLREDGSLVTRLANYNAIDFRARGVGLIHVDEPQKAIISVLASSGMVDYDIAVFEASASIPTPFLRNTPTITPIQLGQTFRSQVLVPGPGKNGAAFCSISLPPGDYKLVCEMRRIDGANSNLQAEISFLDLDGVHVSNVGSINEIQPQAAKAFKLMVSEDLERIVRIAPAQHSTITLKIDRLAEE